MISLDFIFIEIRSSTSLLKADSSLFAIRPTTVVTSANLMIHIIRREGGGAGFIVVGWACNLVECQKLETGWTRCSYPAWWLVWDLEGSPTQLHSMLHRPRVRSLLRSLLRRRCNRQKAFLHRCFPPPDDLGQYEAQWLWNLLLTCSTYK